LPHLQKLYDKYHAAGLSMIAINMVSQQNSMIPDWKAKGKYTFPVLVTEETDYWATNPYKVQGTPTNVLLDGHGNAVFRHTGFGEGGEKMVEAEIRELLGLEPFPADGTQTARQTASQSPARP
jgi:hypothetical protein